MLDLRGAAGLWRSFRNEVQVSRFGVVIASTYARLVGRTAEWMKALPVRLGHAAQAEESNDSHYQAQKMESLGRLTGGVAHDFNNLLTVILGNATALRMTAEARGDTQAVRRAEMIERAAERGGRVAGQLLAFSHRQMLRPQIVSAYRVISEMTDLLVQAAGETVRIRLETEPALWNCRVDPGQLESAILNLVLNGREAMPAGGSITIGCHNHKAQGALWAKPPRAAGDYVRIEVKDTGRGIPPDLLDKVFEPFFSTKPVGQGTGLGLSQVHGFAGQSGGWVQLLSTVDTGTTVSVFLPRDKGREPDDPKPAGSVAPAGNHQTVLVVESDPDLRSTTCETLSRFGYRPLAAADGSVALAHLVSDERIHLLLTEAALPGGLSGIELARSACHLRPDLRVLVASAFSSDAQRGDKPFELLMKPYRPADLVSVVGAVLTRDTFSLETEELLAEARANAPLTLSAGMAARGTPDLYPVEDEDPSKPRPNGVRLGVMPFRTIGSGADSAFALGLAEEITTAFSRFRSIVCAAPASVVALANEPVGQTERWRQLDLDFLVQGSLRKKGDEIRVLLRLVNMRGSGEISWGRRFDSLMPDVLNLQDRIASEIAAQVAPELIVWEGQNAASRPQVDPTAYDLMLRAIPAIYRLDEAGFREAGPLLERSLALAPSSAACHSWLAHWYVFLLGQGWATDTERAVDRADHLSQQAIILDPGDARGFTVAGHVRAFLHRDAQAALWLHERAIALNPSLAMAWCYAGLAHSYLGQHAEAIRDIHQAGQLSPYDPHSFFFDMALMMPLLLTGQYQESARAGRRARDLNPGLSSTYKGLLSALGHLGSVREAAAVRKTLLKLEPRFSIASALRRSPLLRPEDRDRYAEGLRLAGIPDRSRP